MLGQIYNLEMEVIALGWDRDGIYTAYVYGLRLQLSFLPNRLLNWAVGLFGPCRWNVHGVYCGYSYCCRRLFCSEYRGTTVSLNPPEVLSTPRQQHTDWARPVNTSPVSLSPLQETRVMHLTPFASGLVDFCTNDHKPKGKARNHRSLT